jgi:hypothetical protein
MYRDEILLDIYNRFVVQLLCCKTYLLHNLMVHIYCEGKIFMVAKRTSITASATCGHAA